MHPTAIAGGILVYAGAAYGAYWFAKSHKPEDVPGADPASTGGCAFDRLATSYDAAIGSEERVMGYGLMRSWLLRNVKGDVLEISAGTGRNLDHYRLADVSSLTLTDVSAPMLQQAEDKYFNQLQLHYKYPHLRPLFLLGTAEHMVAADNQPPAQHGLHAAAADTSPGSSGRTASSRHTSAPAAGAMRDSTSSSSISSSIPSSSRGSQEADPDASPFQSLWRLGKQTHPQQPGSSSSSSSSSLEQHHHHQQANPLAGVSGAAAGEDAPGTTTATATTTSSGSSSGSSSSSSSSSGSSSTGRAGWWWGRGPCATCQHHSSQDVPSSSSSSSSSSSTFTPGSFDAVVDTFGLCSHEHPVQALQQAALLLKPGGRLYLLEHGRSSSWFGWVRGWLNDYMDRRAAAHHAKWGCWYNRDILDIVQQAHLRVVSCFTWHAGTSYLIVAEPEVAPTGAGTPAAPAA